MAARENYFILLELTFDPPVSDAAVISKAIADKHNQWAQDMRNPIRKAKAGEYLAQEEDIKKVMLDAGLRAAEAEAAKKIREAKRKDLDDKLALLTTRGEELSDKDLKAVLKSFGAVGFTEAAIRKRFREIVEAKSSKKVDLTAVIDKTQARNIQTGLASVGLPEGTLYDFLELPASASFTQLCEKADSVKKKILAKGDKTSADNAAQSLCGLCATVFKDKASKQKYDNYVNLTRYPGINRKVDDAATANKRVIDPAAKETLVDFAVRDYGITPSEASAYISNYCELQGYQEKNRSIICGLCGTENAMGATVCVKCGKPLIVICPNCGAENGNAVKNCAKCGFDMTKTELAVELIQKARTLWNGRKVEEAEAALKEAALYWPSHQDIAALNKDIAAFKERFRSVLGNIAGLIESKKFYTARLSINQAQNDGFTIDREIVLRVQNTIQNIESRLAALKTMSGDEAFAAVLSMTGDIADSAEVNRLIGQYPPEAPAGFRANLVGSTAALNWGRSASRGEVRYVLVRKENTYPNDASDGQVLYSGIETAYSDSSLKKSTVYCYTVFAERAGVYSGGVRLSAPVVAVDNVSGIRAVGGDGMINLSWDKPATVTRVSIGLYCGEDCPADPAAFREVPNNRLDGASITGLANGRKYWLSVSAFHMVGGKQYASAPAFLNAIPEKPAAPIENFRVSYQDEIFRASWDRAEWDVILFWSLTKPSYAAGVTYDIGKVLETFRQIDASFKSLTEAEFTLSFIGECYIIPGQVSASNVILSECVHISSVPAMKDPSFDLNASRTELYVNFTWPKRIENSFLIFRADEFPSNFDDPLGKKVECSKKQYQANEGILINNPPAGRLYALIYSYFESENGRIYSSPVKLIVNNEPQRDVYYTFKYKKSLFSKSRTLQVTVRSSGTFVLPAFCVIGKLKSVPLNRGDGDIICSSGEEREIERTYTYEFDVDDIRKDTKIKLFFMNDKQYQYYKIVSEGSNVIS